ncbi:MAG: hypothetical protein ACP5HF_00140 [Candidatus Micrarchaeia archaeon]
MKIRKILFVGIVVALIMAVFLIALSSYIHSQFKMGVQTYAPQGKPHFNFNIYTEGVLSYSNGQYAVPFAVINYTASNVTNASISISLYTKNPFSNIYYISSPSMSIGAFPDSDVESSLRYALNRYDLLNGYSLNVVNINNAYTIPPRSIVIIATGLLPVSMMPGSGYEGNTTILSLLSKGDTVIYVGGNFSRSIGTGSVIFQTNQQSLQALAKYGIIWNPPITSGSMFYFSKPTFSLPNQYGNVSYANILNGTLIAFSNEPKLAWPNASSMADDIALALYYRFWIPQIAYGNYTLTTPSNGSIGVFALQRYLTYQNSSLINSTYPLINVVYSNSTNYTIAYKQFKIVAIANGSLSIPAQIAETQKVPIVIGMNINSKTKTLVAPHIDIYTSNMSYVSSIPIGFFNTSTGINVIKYVSFSMPHGYYIAVLKDFNNRPYAASLFYLGGVDINPINLNFKNGTFVFGLSSLDMPIADSPYTISLDNSYTSNGTTNNSMIIYTLPKGSVINYGTQTFSIEIFKEKYTYTTSYIKEVFHIPIYYIEFGIVIAIVIILNLVLKAPNRDEYYIDIPDFMPSKKTRVVVSKNEILALFDKINAHYHWKYMPLLPEEIKNSISSNIRYNNMPVSITLQNVIGILTKLVNSGDLLNIKDYYAPKRWIDESGYSIEYLATFRRLRDYCITAGFIFTDLGASPDADMTIAKSGIEALVFIYAESGKRSKIKIGGDTKKFIIFFDEDRKLRFLEALYISLGEESEALKVAISNGLIKLIDTEHLDQLII